MSELLQDKVQEVMLKKPGVHCKIAVPHEFARIGKHLKPRDMADNPSYEPWVVYEILGTPMLLSDAIMLNIPHLNNFEIKEVP